MYFVLILIVWSSKLEMVVQAVPFSISQNHMAVTQKQSIFDLMLVKPIKLILAIAK